MGRLREMLGRTLRLISPRVRNTWGPGLSDTPIEMTEKEWLTTNDLSEMLVWLMEKVTQRQLRLFMCSCARKVAQLLQDSDSQSAIVAGEKFADNLIDSTELSSAFFAAFQASDSEILEPAYFYARTAAFIAATETPTIGDAQCVAWHFVRCGLAETDVRGVCNLLRHIIGNPFHPYQPPASWPSSIVQLAQALYQGEDCAFALADALEEAGHAELAQHFRDEQWHPKGCWAMDAVLGRS